ncbi:MAG: exodeoxyribonuclease VII small subunit [Clostridiales bacterium]|nr:exodeoxyribonuclease VII small subunit [Clostridiales bacterium]
MTFEASMLRLEEIVKEMESGELSLEQSMKLYEEGTKLALKCKGQLEKAQMKITTLGENKEQNGNDNE